MKKNMIFATFLLSIAGSASAGSSSPPPPPEPTLKVSVTLTNKSFFLGRGTENVTIEPSSSVKELSATIMSPGSSQDIGTTVYKFTATVPLNKSFSIGTAVFRPSDKRATCNNVTVNSNTKFVNIVVDNVSSNYDSGRTCTVTPS